MSGSFDLAISLAAGVVIAFGLLYVILLTSLGLWSTRRAGVGLADQEGLLDQAPDPDADLQGFSFFFLVPALDEEEVIGGTIESLLREQAGATVVVIDDGSTDRTPEIVSSYEDGGRVILLRRVPPNARKGKGRALNAGLEIVRSHVERAGLSTSAVIVGVMDADGRMTPNATAAVAEPFARDPSVGGLQFVVRIRNRDSLALSFQDMEFWAMAGVGQLGRVPFGSVSMGGNGQFTRLSALDEVGREPWSESLTEDLDLGISLSAAGWRTTSTPHAYVTQQGVADIRRLVRQRTRWYQGHMLSIRRLPELARSRYLPTHRFLELAAYLAIPWAISLPWSIIQQYMLFQLLTGRGLPDPGTSWWVARAAAGLAWYVLSFAPHVFWGVTYWRRSRTVSLKRALLMAHLMIPWSYVAHVAAWSAFGRIVFRRNGWVKTARETEDSALVAPA